MKTFSRFWKNFFIMIWHMIVSMKTKRGLVALCMSYMLFHGWAVIMVVMGSLSQTLSFVGIGMAVILFWFGPGTPLIPLIIATALIIKRYVLFDKTNQLNIKDTWKELNQTNKR